MASAKPGDGAGHVGDGGGRDGRDDAGGADRDDDVAGSGGQPEGGRRVVAGAGPQHRRRTRERADLLGRAGDPGDDRAAAAHRQLQQVEAVLAGAGRPVGGAAGVPAVGDQGVQAAVGRQPPGQPVVGEADGGGAVGVRPARRRPASAAWSPVKEATGTSADGVGPRLPARRLVPVPQLGDQVGRGTRGADVVPQQRVPDDGAVLVEADHAVLLPAHRPARRRRPVRRRRRPRR